MRFLVSACSSDAHMARHGHQRFIMPAISTRSTFINPTILLSCSIYLSSARKSIVLIGLAIVFMQQTTLLCPRGSHAFAKSSCTAICTHSSTSNCSGSSHVPMSLIYGVVSLCLTLLTMRPSGCRTWPVRGGGVIKCGNILRLISGDKMLNGLLNCFFSWDRLAVCRPCTYKLSLY